MINRYLKIGFRNITKNKGFFALNAGGLIIGLTAVLLISLWVHSELSYNKSLTNYDEIVSLMQKQTRPNNDVRTYTGQPLQLAPVLRDNYASHFKHVVTSSRQREYNIKYNEDMLLAGGRFADPDFTKILDLAMIEGNRDALTDISSVLISKSLSKSIFGDENPIGKTIQLISALDVKVAGVYEDLPRNSTFSSVKFIAPWDLLKKRANYEGRLGWGNYWFQVYAQLNHKDDLAKTESIIKNVFNDNYLEKSSDRDYKLFLHPMSKWHLYSKFENGVNVGGRIEYVNIFSIIGIFILLLACINFMNLSTAYALKRGKEVGVRKTLGSSRKQLITQFFSESFIIILFSFTISILLAYILLPKFNLLTLKEISIPFTASSFWLSCGILILITAVLSSLYPSIYLSAFNPVTVLKKGLGSDKKSSVSLRKVLIVVQFAISSFLIMGTLTIISQINYAKDRPLGFNKDLLVSVPINNQKARQSFDVIKQELLASNNISQVTASDVKITAAYTTNGGSFNWKNKDPKMNAEFYTIRATHGFGKMVDWKILQGRDFSEKFPSDTLAFLMNETAVKYTGLENPVGEYISWGKNQYKVIGVVKDMVTRSPFDPITPSLFILHKGDFLSYVNVKIAANSPNIIEGAINNLKNTFQKYDPKNIFSYSFIDEEYERKFNAEKRVAKLVGWFSFVAIFISCLGVLGLSTYMAIQRKKEIGIRKVLGASVLTIWELLSKQFVVLVLISLVIALPIGYYFSSQWLMEYSYRIQIGFWIFALSGGFILGITILTVSYQSIKSATSNPVNSIRTE